MAQLMNITPAQKADVPAIHAMMHEFVTFLNCAHLFTLSPAQMEDVLFGDNTPCRPFICTLDSHIIGFANIQTATSTLLGNAGIFIEDLYITPAQRGNGYGTQLFDFIMNYASTNNHTYVNWGAASNNAKALEFYKKTNAETSHMVNFILRDRALTNFKKAS